MSSPSVWASQVAQDPQLLSAWVHALASGHFEVSRLMLRFLEGNLDPFQRHLHAEFFHGQRLHVAVHDRRELYRGDPDYRAMEREMLRLIQFYVRTFFGYASRQSDSQDAQYGMAAVALGSRVFRHYSELKRACDGSGICAPLAETLGGLMADEAHHVRQAEKFLLTLPQEVRSTYRSVRSFEELLFERLVRKLLKFGGDTPVLQIRLSGAEPVARSSGIFAA